MVGYLAIFISIPLLVVLNCESSFATQHCRHVVTCFLSVALTGYQDVTRVSTNYNATQFLWFNGFIPSAKPGSLCDPHILALGDTFSTNYNVFTWTITAIGSRTGDTTVHQAGVEYKSQPLVCDAAVLELIANANAFSVTMIAFVICITPEFNMTLTGTFTATTLQVGSTSMSGQVVNGNVQNSAATANLLYVFS